MKVFYFIWLRYPLLGITNRIVAYDLKQARKKMLKYVKSNFYEQLGQDPVKNRKGYFRQI